MCDVFPHGRTRDAVWIVPRELRRRARQRAEETRRGTARGKNGRRRPGPAPQTRSLPRPQRSESACVCLAALEQRRPLIRYAARIAIESQAIAEWQEKALAEEKPTAGLTALLALARLGDKETQHALLRALARWPLDSLDETRKLIKLRVMEVSLARQGRPSEDLIKVAIEKLDRQYPAKSWPLNRELSQLLIYLEAPDVVTKTLALLDAAPTQEEQIHYIFSLRTLKAGWTAEAAPALFQLVQQGPRRIESSDRPGPVVLRTPGVITATAPAFRSSSPTCGGRAWTN